MQRLPSLLHGQAEAGRHRRPCGALRAPLRPAGQEALKFQVPELAEDEARRRALLWRAKLRALVAAEWGAAEAAAGDTAESYPFGAAHRSALRNRGWVLTQPVPSALGPALIWALRGGVGELHVLVDDGDPAAQAHASGVLARRAQLMSLPVRVHAVDGRRLRPTTAARLVPPPTLAELVGRHPDLGALADLLRVHGADPVVEDGQLVGEVLGLEVARTAVEGEDGPARLEVGIGRHDRDARAEMRPGETAAAALDEVVAVVRRHRRYRAARHPANALAREAWLRSAVMAHPLLVGARTLDRQARAAGSGLRGPRPASATGTGVDDVPVVVACSIGVDLDLAPAAADQRAALEAAGTPGARLLFAVPHGDDYPVTHLLAAALARPAHVTTVPRDWPALLDG